MHSDCFQDNLSFAADLFVTADGDIGQHEARELASGDTLAPLLAAHGRAHTATEPRAIASQWSKWAFARLIIPTVVLQCRLDRRVRFDGSPAWRFDTDSDGTPSCFVFDGSPLDDIGTGHDFASLIDHALAPLTAALCRTFGLSPRVYGSNAAMYFCWALDQLTLQGVGPATTRAAAYALTEAPQRPDGGANPFHAPFKALGPGAHDGTGQPARECRRLCCVRDLDRAWDLCANCPRAVTYENAAEPMIG